MQGKRPTVTMKRSCFLQNERSVTRTNNTTKQNSQRGNATEHHGNPKVVKTFYLTGEPTSRPATGADGNVADYDNNWADYDSDLADCYDGNVADCYDSNEADYYDNNKAGYDGNKTGYDGYDSYDGNEADYDGNAANYDGEVDYDADYDGEVDYDSNFGGNDGMRDDESLTVYERLGDNNSVHEADNGNRQAYSREFKISVLEWHYKNGSVKNKTAKHFSISRQNVLRWIRTEAVIRNGKKGAKRFGNGRPPMYPLMEHKLHAEFLELRDKGLKIRNMWFMTR
jgi:hypothetical protein